MLTTVFVVVAIICFALAALGFDGRLTPIGLAFLAAAHLPL